MNELKPFGDVPHKLGVQLRRSFVATRTFYIALQKGATVAQNMMAVRPVEDCWREITAMRFCGVCRGDENPAPCLEYCSSTLQTCFKQFAALEDHWDNYIGKIIKFVLLRNSDLKINLQRPWTKWQTDSWALLI